ncbi:MAG: hypothetical protein AAFZ07_12805 [Actinomycetota bacterium]
MAYTFLSDDWFEAIEALREEYDDRLPEIPVDAKVNVTVRETPFSEGELQLHVDTTGGYPVLVRQHLDGPDLSVTTDYGVATNLFVQRDPQLVMQSFLEGRILVQGDVTKVMSLAQADPGAIDPAAGEFAEKVIALTEVPD